MPHHRMVFLLLPLLLVCCATLPVVDASVRLGEIATGAGAIRWSRVASSTDGSVIVFSNRSDRPVELRISVPPQSVGSRIVHERQQTGTREVEMCDPVTQECYTEEEPVFELVAVRESIYADVTVEPRSLAIAPEQSVEVKIIRAPDQRDLDYSASILVRILGTRGSRHLIEIDFSG